MFVSFYGVQILTDPVLLPRIGVNAWVTTPGSAASHNVRARAVSAAGDPDLERYCKEDPEALSGERNKP